MPSRHRTIHAAPVLVLAILATALIAACGEDGGGDEAEAEVVATTGIAADIARRVAGEDAEVTQIVPEGSNPHSYSPSASEQQSLAAADLLVFFDPALEQGLPLETAENRFAIADHVGELREVGEDEVVDGHGDDGADEDDHHEDERLDQGHTEDEHAGENHAEKGDAGEGHAEDEHTEESHAGEESHEHAGGEDPHVWLDPLAVAAALPALAQALGEVDPDHVDEYAARAEEYGKELERLHEELSGMVAAVPARNRKLVTSHDLVGWFADRYGFEVVGAPFGTTPEAEASAGAVAELIDRVETERVPAVFAQQGDDPKVLRLIAEEAGVEVVDDLLLESLGEQAGSYVEMMRFSTRRITDALSD